MNVPIPRTSRQLQLTARVIAAYGLFIVGVIGFVEVASEVREPETLAGDRLVLQLVHTVANPFLDKVVPFITDIGGPVGTVLITCAIGLSLFLHHYRKRSILILASVVGATGINLIMKSLFERERPNLWERLVVEHSYSFPSGHATVSAALGAAIIIASWHTRWRWWGAVLGLLYPLVIGLTRLYLGVHYPTDVLAGWMVGGTWTAIVAAILYSSLSRRTGLTK